MNLRFRSKPKAVVPRTASKPAPTPSNNLNVNEVYLRGLRRAELQKIAKAHGIKANLDNESIIQQLLSRQTRQRKRPAEDHEEERLQKRIKLEDKSELASIPVAPRKPAVPLRTQPVRDTSTQSTERQPSEDGPLSRPRSNPLPQNPPTMFSYDRALFSETESEMTEEEQLDYATPVSSRSGTPPMASIAELKGCVREMQQISSQDQELLRQIEEMSDKATKIRKRANDVRAFVKAERARRERMEAYFRYWQETDGKWDRRWMRGEETREDEVGPAGPSSMPAPQHSAGNPNVNGEQGNPPAQAGRPMLSPEEVKKKREAIIAKQEAEQRELLALNSIDRHSSGDRYSTLSLTPAESSRGKEVLPMPSQGSMGAMVKSS